MGTIFISYRRSDSHHPTGRVYDRLARHFGADSVFKDVDNIPVEADFTQRPARYDRPVRRAARRRWRPLARGRESGRGACLDDPEDCVRMESRGFPRSAHPIIPLLVGESRIPRPVDPAALSPNRSPISRERPVRPDPDFHRDVDRLITVPRAPSASRGGDGMAPRPRATRGPSPPPGRSTSSNRRGGPRAGRGRLTPRRGGWRPGRVRLCRGRGPPGGAPGTPERPGSVRVADPPP